MDEVVLGLGSVSCLVFTDDVLIWGKTIEEQTDCNRSVNVYEEPMSC